MPLFGHWEQHWVESKETERRVRKEGLLKVILTVREGGEGSLGKVWGFLLGGGSKVACWPPQRTGVMGGQTGEK